MCSSDLTVYAVPQVLAATAPVAAVSVQVGTLVKLVRVLMLGPVVLALSLGTRRRRVRGEAAAAPERLALHRLVPWFILAFLALTGLRSAGLIPEAALPAISGAAKALAVVSMAALGLGVDARSVARAGPRLVLAVVASLAALTAVSLGLIRLLALA